MCYSNGLQRCRNVSCASWQDQTEFPLEAWLKWVSRSRDWETGPSSYPKPTPVSINLSYRITQTKIHFSKSFSSLSLIRKDSAWNEMGLMDQLHTKGWEHFTFVEPSLKQRCALVQLNFLHVLKERKKEEKIYLSFSLCSTKLESSGEMKRKLDYYASHLREWKQVWRTLLNLIR